MSKENKSKGNKRFEVIENQGFAPTYEVTRLNGYNCYTVWRSALI